MSVIAARKCVRHPVREAVARCPSCSENFCRECVVEHDGILLCASCLAREKHADKKDQRSKFSQFGQLLITASCIGLLWVVFYAFGQLLKAIPTELHEGTVWEQKDSDS